MELDSLSPALRRDLRDAFDQLASLLEEETSRLPGADAAELGLYADAKRVLFEQLGYLLREALREPAGVVPSAATPDATAGDAVDQDGEEVLCFEVLEHEAADADSVRNAARRLKARVEENRRGIQAAQDAVAAVARQLAKAVDLQNTDGVYARHGTVPKRGQAGFGRVQHDL